MSSRPYKINLMKRLSNASVSAEGKLEITFVDSELNYNQDARVFDLVKWRENEATWDEVRCVLKDMEFDDDSLDTLKELLDILIFDNGDQG